MSTITKKSFDDQLLEGLEDWRKNHPKETHWDNETVAQWLIDKKGYGLEKRVARKEIARRLAKAENRKRQRNEQGKRVRVYHAAKLPVPSKKGGMVQKTFWAHRSEVSASFAHSSFEQRQKQAEGFCRSMCNDAQDLNDNNPNLKGNLIQLDLDFSYVEGSKAVQRVQTIPTEIPHDSKKLAKKKPR
jgi:hypothetical protein